MVVYGLKGFSDWDVVLVDFVVDVVIIVIFLVFCFDLVCWVLEVGKYLLLEKFIVLYVD